MGTSEPPQRRATRRVKKPEVTSHEKAGRLGLEKIERKVTGIFMTEILESYDFRCGRDQRTFVPLLMLQEGKQNQRGLPGLRQS